MGRYKTFSPPTDTSVWSTLTADNDVIGFGDATHDFFRGRRYVGEYKGEGLGSLLGSLWALVRPTLRDIGKSSIPIFRDIGKTAISSASKDLLGKRGHGVDIFSDGKRRQTSIVSSSSKGYKKGSKKE